jgi:hypothetical protein
VPEACFLKEKFLLGRFESFHKNRFDGIALGRIFD